jgi:acyl-CoA synthetase (AMP-forming)/AMP-acid ligase II
MNIAEFLAESARRSPDALALRFSRTQRTYAECSERVARLAGALRQRGIVSGDRIATLLPNRAELLETMLACFHAGACVVPINARATPFEAAHMLTDADVHAIVYDAAHRAHAEIVRDRLSADPILICTDRDEQRLLFEELIADAEPVPCTEVEPAAPAWLFYSSGTTGRMKGATLNHRNLLFMSLAYLAELYQLGPDDIVLHVAPLTHGSGLYAIPPLARHSTQLIADTQSFSPEETLRIVERERVTVIAFLVPTMVRRLTEAQRVVRADTTSLRCAVYGGAPMYVSDLAAALETFGPVFAQIYGQAEAPVTISRMDMATHRELYAAGDTHRLGSAGVPYLGTTVRVISDDGEEQPSGEVGEVLIKGDVVMSGYWGDPKATSAALVDGWLRTGDLGYLDERGWLYLVDRSKDVIISGGANIYPREIEEVVLRHPAIREAAVIGAPDREWGEHVVCFAVPDREQTSTDQLESELEALCRSHLAGYKCPRVWEWIEELPKSANGKILKRDLREPYWAGHTRRI